MTVEQLLNFLTVVIPPAITAAAGILMGKRMRQASAVKTEAEAERIIAEAKRIFAEAESEEVRSMAQVMDAWKTLNDATNARLNEQGRELTILRLEYNRVLDELREYRHGVAVLITQIKSLGHHPHWVPRQGDSTDGTKTGVQDE